MRMVRTSRDTVREGAGAREVIVSITGCAQSDENFGNVGPRMKPARDDSSNSTEKKSASDGFSKRTSNVMR